ncbi:hypothetical protein HBI26_020770 [Parastagonospora nodorum]|nr:hypothetical protein HBH68_089230 [Parastagonospora nodorum]KAH5437723.1 hypothetical protein HBI32_030270 [Parastagonospora nodorum]KAH5610605.1 hypothetical protein HBI26_020770 [Parastagonospora nodorum]KAH6129412.1 hypothetical protein HBI69_008870 [Parastagonospora nodorum]
MNRGAFCLAAASSPCLPHATPLCSPPPHSLEPTDSSPPSPISFQVLFRIVICSVIRFPATFCPAIFSLAPPWFPGNNGASPLHNPNSNRLGVANVTGSRVARL